MNKEFQGLGNMGLILAEGGETTQRRRLLGSASDRDGGVPGSWPESGWGSRGQGQGCGAGDSGWRGGLRPKGRTPHAAPAIRRVSPSLGSYRRNPTREHCFGLPAGRHRLEGRGKGGLFHWLLSATAINGSHCCAVLPLSPVAPFGAFLPISK